MFAFNDVEPADAGGYVDAYRVSNGWRDLQTCHAQGKIGGRHGELDEAAHLFQLFFGDPVQRVEIADFSGNTAVEQGGIELRDRTDATGAGQKSFPHLVGPDAQGTNQTDTRYHYPAPQVRFSSKGFW